MEDDPLFGESVVDFLEEEGFVVTLCPNGNEALNATYSQRFDLYLLDINVPLLNGLNLLDALRQSEDETPAIFLTSHQSIEMLTHAFEIGANDYLKKPFQMEELLVRIKALLRRTKKSRVLEFGAIRLDEMHKCAYYNGAPLSLSAKEFQLLSLLLEYAGDVVTKEMIVDRLWSPSEMISEGAIRVYINRLKQELGNEEIVNIRGIGYRLVQKC